jgi:thioesterase domain-containing protein
MHEVNLPAIDRSCLVTLHEGTWPKPLFCLHAIGGGLASYSELIAALGREYTVYGLQAFSRRGGRPPLTSIEDMARHYVDHMRSVQPEGPYYVFGWSLGGLTAYEIARGLDSAERGLIALGDTQFEEDGPRPENGEVWQRRRWLAYLYVATGHVDRALESSTHGFWALNDADRLRFTLESAQRHENKRFLALIALDSIEAHHAVFLGLWQAARRYRCRPLDGRIVFFRATAERDDRAAKWANAVHGQCDVVEVPGDHLAILRAPAVERIADELRSRLRDCA